MQASYTKNYIQTYIWKALSFVVGFLSLFIVVPFLSSNKELYGLYTFCASFQLYLSYADIGFLSAGQKYAAECFAKDDREGETRIFGFVGFILLCLIVPFSISLCYAAFNPSIVITDLSPENIPVVRLLFLTIAIVSPIQVLLQRVSQSVLTIRVKEYVSSRIDIIGSLVKIGSVLFFFTGGRYMICEYFLFINCVTIVCCLITISIIRKNENYHFRDVIKAIRWSKPIFDQIKYLAFSSLGATVAWLLYYELDLIYIGKLFSITDVAYYSVCFTLLNFIRNISNIIYGPYSQRINHFVALKDESSIKRMLHTIVKNTCPLYVFGCCLLSSISFYFIMLWVGKEYMPSVPILSVLAFFFAFHFISQPAGYLAIAKEQYTIINVQSLGMSILFLALVFILRTTGIGLMSFVIAKVSIAVLQGIYLAIFLSKTINLWNAIKVYLLQVVISTVIICVLMRFILGWLYPNPDKSSVGLIGLISICACALTMFGLVVYATNKTTREFVLSKINIWKK